MPDLIYEKRGEIAFLTLNRPERRNAFSPQMMVQLAAAWRDFRDDDDARVAILTGAGAESFCAGGDLELLILLGDRISAEEAHRIGLINEVVEPEEVMPRAEEIARRLAKNGPLALRKIKEVVLRTNGLPILDAFEIESECSAVAMSSKDAREGPRAFREKREPVYTGE